VPSPEFLEYSCQSAWFSRFPATDYPRR
jgi:hypothetical protein